MSHGAPAAFGVRFLPLSRAVLRGGRRRSLPEAWQSELDARIG
jgi:hypothetical protein